MQNYRTYEGKENPNIAKAEGTAVSPATGFPLRYNKASKGDAVVVYCESSATPKMRHHRLSRRVNNRAFFYQFADVILGANDKNG